MRIRFTTVLLLSLLNGSVVWGENEFRDPPFLIGHNLTPTSYTLKENQWTLGTYAVSYGVTERLLVGTSPTFILLYNMPMVNVRYGRPIAHSKFRWGWDFNYFHTLPFLAAKFEQHSVFGRLLLGYDVSAQYKVHASAGWQYFIDDTKPYSLRLNPQGGARSNFSLSTLHEVWYSDQWGMFYEFGFLGLNYPTPYMHLGFSAFYHWDGFYAQAGLSDSFSLGSIPQGSNTYTHMIHLEVQLQFLL